MPVSKSAQMAARLMAARLMATWLGALVLTGNGAAALAGEGDFAVSPRGLGTAARPDAAAGSLEEMTGDEMTGRSITPRLGLSYFITDNLIAGFAFDGGRQGAEIPARLSPGFGHGDFGEPPPAVTLQYHFPPDNGFNAYLGAGMDFTNRAPGQDQEAGAGGGVGSDFNYALQAGFDYYFRENWAINFDLKAVFTDRDAALDPSFADGGGGELNPWVAGVGFTFRF